MVKNGFPCYTLATQHRMRPEISALMKPIYPFLMDHKSVKHRNDIGGVTKNIYFIHHTVNEEKVRNIIDYWLVTNNLLFICITLCLRVEYTFNEHFSLFPPVTTYMSR